MKFPAQMLKNSQFRFLCLLILLLSTTDINAQLWTEDFEAPAPYANIDTNTVDQSSSGQSGLNLWLINDSYTGGTVGSITVNPTPPQPAGISSANGNYLHITSRLGLTIPAPLGPITNAHFNNGAPNNEAYFTSINTALSTTGQTGITMSFWMLNASPAATVEIYVKDGAAGAWTQLSAADFSVSLGGIAANWTQVVYNGNALDNVGNIFLGFKYIAQTTGTFPSLSIDDIEINAAAPVTATIVNPTVLTDTVCPGETITFQADSSNPGIVTYKWSFNGANNGTQIDFGKTVYLTAANNPGTYSIDLEVTDNNVTDQTSFTLVIDTCTPPTINISATPTTICQNFNANFVDATTVGYVTAPILSRQWTFPGGFPNSSTLANPSISYTTPGLYDVYYEVTDKNGTYYDTLFNYIEVVVCPVPIADFNVSDSILCPGDCINFFDQSQNMIGSNLTWLWEFPGSDSATSTVQSPQNICYQTPGTYSVTLTSTNANGTDMIVKTAYITVDSCLAPEVSFSAEEQKVCEATCIQFYNQTIRADSFVWVFEGIDGNDTVINVENPIVCYSDTGLFNVFQFAINDYGPDALLEPNYISVKGYPDVLASPDTSLYIGQSVGIFAYGEATDFTWEPNYNLSCIKCRETTVSPIENTVYYVTNTNDHNCSSTDSVIVRVRKEYYKGVPDIFSPNGDGSNDVLYVLGNGIAEVEFFIYDRYGKKIFESNDQEIGWDGTYKGEAVNPGVFIYMAKITHINGYQEVIKGDVTLIR